MRLKVKKAVIPAAGLGTRFLPATKTVPKELFPLVDRPILLYIVEEIVRAGITDIVIVAGRGKGAIEDFFDSSVELERALEQSKRHDLYDDIIRLKDLANIISIRQKSPQGLGHAVLAARPVIGKEAFAVLLGDEVMISEDGQPSGIQELCDTYEREGMSAAAILEVPRSDAPKYGMIESEPHGRGLHRITNVVEKPTPENTPSSWALPGRYVFDSHLFELLQNLPPGKNGEIQLTDAMTLLAKSKGLLGQQLAAHRFDAGDKLGYLQANIELALRRPELSKDLKIYLKQLAGKL